MAHREARARCRRARCRPDSTQWRGAGEGTVVEDLGRGRRHRGGGRCRSGVRDQRGDVVGLVRTRPRRRRRTAARPARSRAAGRDTARTVRAVRPSPVAAASARSPRSTVRSFTIKDQSDDTTKVKTSSDTKVTTSETGSIDDIKVGDTVSVVGTGSATKIAATTVNDDGKVSSDDAAGGPGGTFRNGGPGGYAPPNGATGNGPPAGMTPPEGFNGNGGPPDPRMVDSFRTAARSRWRRRLDDDPRRGEVRRLTARSRSPGSTTRS